MRHIKARERRYLLMALVFSVVWGIGFARLRQADSFPPRDTADSLIQDAQPVSPFDSVWVGESVQLTGSLAFVEQRPYPYHRIARLDLATGAVTSLFDIPDGALVYHIVATPDPDTLLMTYSPSEVRYDRSGLYTVSLTDKTVAWVMGGETSATYYAQPQWVGEFITYAVYERETQARRVERYNTRTGRVSVVAEDAIAPLVSADGMTVLYLRVNPSDGARSLWVAELADGIASEVVSERDFADIDVPTLSPDGAWVYFTALESSSAVDRVLEVVFGAGRVHAHGNHNVPMRWYRVSVDGGAPQPVTSDSFITLYGGLSAAAALGFVSDTGFYVAQADRIDQLIQSRVMRSFVWLSHTR
jgi:hypothetical protein